MSTNLTGRAQRRIT